MPKQTAKGGLWARLGDRARKAFDKHKGDETEYSNFGSLPAGIENGIAQLTSISFGQFKEGKNKGKDYFMAMGSVVLPEYGPDGTPVRGLFTKIGPEPLCDTPDRTGRKTEDDHVAWMLNELRKLGLGTEELDGEGLEPACQELVNEGPYFRFRTWKGAATKEYPDPRTNETWAGRVDYSPPEDDDDTVDRTGDKVTSVTKAATTQTNGKPRPGAARPSGPATKPTPAPTATGTKGKKSPPPPPEEEFDETTGDLNALATAADAGDDAAMEQLTAQLLGMGFDQDTIDNAENWASLVEMDQTTPTDEEEEEGDEEEEPAEEEAEWAPEKGQVYNYRPMVLDKKTKKQVKAKKPVEAEVLAVNVKARTVDLKNLDTGAKVPKVSWDDLESGEEE